LSPFLRAVDKEEEQNHLQQVLTDVSDILKRITSGDDERQEALRQAVKQYRAREQAVLYCSARHWNSGTDESLFHISAGGASVV